MKSKRMISAFLFACVLVAFGNGCDGGREGDRCNPNLSHNDCDDGLTCQITTNCGEAYCCPANPSTSASPVCNGSPEVNAACPAPEAASPEDAGGGETGAADGGADAGGG